MKTPNKFLKTAILLFAVVATAYGQPTDNVVAYFSFNGNANDVTGNGKNATVTGASLTADRLSKTNDAYSFNGTSNLIYIPNNLMAGNTAFCVSLWFKSDGITSNNGQVLIDFRGQYNCSVNFYSNNPTYQQAVLFNIAAPSPSISCVSPNNTIQYGVWYHVVANYGNNIMQLFVNGSLVDSKTQTPPNACSGYYSAIGKDYRVDLNRCWFYGSIDEVLIYKRSLTASEVLALYNRGLASSEIPELYAPIKYTYDVSGNRTNRNLITLKSAPAIVQRDSAGLGQAFASGEVFEDNVGDQKVVIYPNPTKGQLLVEIQGYEKVTHTALYLFDLSGQLLISKKPANSSMPLDLTGYPAGTYVLKIALGDKTSEWKIVKE